LVDPGDGICAYCAWQRLFTASQKKTGDLMNARLRSAVRRGSILVLAGLALASGCTPKRGGPFAIPVPLQLQTAVAVDKDGNQILAGSFAGKLKIGDAELTSAGGTDIFVTKTSKTGAPVFPPQRFGGAGDDAATGVAVDQDGSIVVSGTIQGEVAFGDQKLKAEVRHARQRAVFVARLDPSGKVIWVRQIAVANLPTMVSVAIGPDRNVVVGATATGTITKPDGPAAFPGESVTLDILSAAGETQMQPPGSQVRALSMQVGCAHSPCKTGGVLVPGCGPDACTAWICSVDSFCCNVEWDSICVGEVGSVCQRRCDCGQICVDGNAFYPDACLCTAEIFSVDPYCGQTWWDGICIGEVNSVCHMACP
jgi:hypothetical protein